MSANLNPSTGPQSTYVKKRRLHRDYRHYFVRVRGRDKQGRRFKLYTVLDNISAGGVYLRLPAKVEPGARLSLVVRFSTLSFNSGDDAQCLVVRGTVIRSEQLSDGTQGVAVRFTRHRFI